MKVLPWAARWPDKHQHSWHTHFACTQVKNVIGHIRLILAGSVTLGPKWASVPGSTLVTIATMYTIHVHTHTWNNTNSWVHVYQFCFGPDVSQMRSKKIKDTCTSLRTNLLQMPARRPVETPVHAVLKEPVHRLVIKTPLHRLLEDTCAQTC